MPGSGAGTLKVWALPLKVRKLMWASFWGAQVFPGGRVLTLASARASDSGSYSCVAVSAVGEDRRDVILSVHGECQPQGAV